MLPGFLGWLLLLPGFSFAQKLTLDKANEMARQHYPLIKQRALLQQTTALSLDNLTKGYWPQFSLSGQATYQSDVTRISLPIPGISITPPSKDQYKIVADLNQVIYDGGLISTQKTMQQLGEKVEQDKIEVELYKLKDRINQLFLGILYLDAQLKQVKLIRDDLQNGISKTEAMVNNGVAFRSNLNVLKAELLKADEREIETAAARKGLLDVLSLFLDQPLPESTQLETPVPAGVAVTDSIRRPELKLFGTQKNLLGSQYKLIEARNRPRASVFAQGGYGRPGLNMLKNDFTFYGIAGLRFSWAFGGLYTRKKEKQLIDINKKTIDIQEETFLLNTHTAMKQQQADIDKLEKLIAKDEAIIGLREKVKEAAKAQLENGVITANDYLREVNAEDQSRQNLLTHRVQLLQAQINYQTISGNQ
ncbi:MAG: TolC family protein [Ferruginibacter sp.]